MDVCRALRQSEWQINCTSVEPQQIDTVNQFATRYESHAGNLRCHGRTVSQRIWMASPESQESRENDNFIQPMAVITISPSSTAFFSWENLSKRCCLQKKNANSPNESKSMVCHKIYKQQPTARCTRKTSNNYVYLVLCASTKLSNVETMTRETNDEQDVAQKPITVINLEQTKNQLNSLSLHLVECELRWGETTFEPEPEYSVWMKRWKENAILIFGCSCLCKCKQNFYFILFILVGKFIFFLPIFRSTFSPIIQLCIVWGSWQWVYGKLCQIIKSFLFTMSFSKKSIPTGGLNFLRKGSEWIGGRQGFLG